MKNTLKILTISGALYPSSITSAFAWGLVQSIHLDYYYENFSNGMSCTTTTIGDYTYTNCF